MPENLKNSGHKTGKGQFSFQSQRKMKVKVAQSCPTLCDPIDYTDHGILQARILEWVAFSFSRGSFQSRDQTQVSHIAGGFIPKKGNAKECSNYHTISLISHTSKVMIKFLQARLQQYVTWEFPDVQAEFRKDRGSSDQIANIHWIIEKARELQEKRLLLLHWLHQVLWLCGSQQTVENSSRDGNTRPPYQPPEKPLCSSRSNS